MLLQQRVWQLLCGPGRLRDAHAAHLPNYLLLSCLSTVSPHKRDLFPVRLPQNQVVLLHVYDTLQRMNDLGKRGNCELEWSPAAWVSILLENSYLQRLQCLQPEGKGLVIVFWKKQDNSDLYIQNALLGFLSVTPSFPCDCSAKQSPVYKGPDSRAEQEGTGWQEGTGCACREMQRLLHQHGKAKIAEHILPFPLGGRTRTSSGLILTCS